MFTLNCDDANAGKAVHCYDDICCIKSVVKCKHMFLSWSSCCFSRLFCHYISATFVEAITRLAATNPHRYKFLL